MGLGVGLIIFGDPSELSADDMIRCPPRRRRCECAQYKRIEHDASPFGILGSPTTLFEGRVGEWEDIGEMDEGECEEMTALDSETTVGFGLSGETIEVSWTKCKPAD